MTNLPFLPLFRSSIRVRLTLPFLLITIAVAGLGIFVVTRLVAGSIQERLGNQLADSAKSAVQASIELEQAHLGALRLMVNTVDVDVAIREVNIAAIDTLLRPLAISEGVDRMIVFDPNATNLYQLDATTESDPNAIDISDWPSVARVLEKQADALGDKFTQIHFDDDQAYFYTVAPVLSVDNALVGGILVGTRMTTAVSFMRDQAIAQVALYALDGRLLASTLAEDPPKLTPAEINELLGAAIETSVIGDLDTTDTAYQTLFTTFQLRSAPVGIKMIALPRDFVAERIGVSRNSVALVFIAFFVVILIVGLSISRSIVVPLYRLVFTTRQIRDGNLEQRARLVSRDELGELGESFDLMTDKLVARTQHIRRLYVEQQQETARRNAMLESIGDAVLVLDSNGQELLRNSAADEMFEVTETNPTAANELGKIIRQPSSYFEAQIIRLGQYHYSVLANAVTLRPKKGKTREIGHVVAFTDITDIIEAEKAKDDIIMQIQHELRTPLSAVSGFVELLGIVNELDDESTELLRNATHHIGQLRYMIDEVIEVSSILSNRFELSFTNVDLVHLVNRILEEHQDRLAEKQIDLHVSMPDRLPVEADDRRLQQSLEHILNNARQYTLAGGAVSVRVAKNGTHAVIEVKDSGVGIKSDEIDRVFERMYRGSAADAGATDTRGLGVGLFLSREIIERHGGEIAIDSTIDKGTTVRVRLPMLKP